MKKIGGQSNYFKVLVCGVFSMALLATVSCGGGSRGVPAVDRNADQSANAVAANSDQTKLHLGTFQELAGSDYLMAAVSSASSRESYLKDSYSSREENRYMRNFLFVNVTDQSSHMLFPANDLLILSVENLTGKTEAKPPAKNAAPQSSAQTPEKAENKAGDGVKWICYRVIKADTDHDKHLNANDLMTIALSDVSGLNYTELLSDVRAVLHQTRRADSLIFIYTAHGKNHIAEINLQTKQLISSKPLQEIALQ
jgi:hypothetical protein